MQGFQGLNHEQSRMIRPLFPKPPSNKFGRKDLSPKKVMNTILWILVDDLPHLYAEAHIKNLNLII